MELKKIVPYYYSKNIFLRNLFWERLRLAIKLSRRKLESGQDLKVLDVGCGQGIFLELLEKTFNNVNAFGIDIEPNVIEVKYKKGLKAEIQIGDIRNSGFPCNFFDIIFCLDILEHFQNLEEPLAEIKRILKTDGLLIVSLPTENFFYKICRFLITGTISMITAPCSPHFYGADSIEKLLLENNFELIDKKTIPALTFLNLFNLLALKIRKN